MSDVMNPSFLVGLFVWTTWYPGESPPFCLFWVNLIHRNTMSHKSNPESVITPEITIGMGVIACADQCSLQGLNRGFYRGLLSERGGGEREREFLHLILGVCWDQLMVFLRTQARCVDGRGLYNPLVHSCETPVCVCARVLNARVMSHKLNQLSSLTLACLQSCFSSLLPDLFILGSDIRDVTTDRRRTCKIGARHRSLQDHKNRSHDSIFPRISRSFSFTHSHKHTRTLR